MIFEKFAKHAKSFPYDRGCTKNVIFDVYDGSPLFFNFHKSAKIYEFAQNQIDFTFEQWTWDDFRIILQAGSKTNRFKTLRYHFDQG